MTGNTEATERSLAMRISANSPSMARPSNAAASKTRWSDKSRVARDAQKAGCRRPNCCCNYFADAPDFVPGNRFAARGAQRGHLALHLMKCSVNGECERCIRGCWQVRIIIC